MNDPASRKTEAGGGLGVTGLASTQSGTRCRQVIFTGCSMNGLVNSATHDESRIRGIDDHIDFKRGDVGEDGRNRRRRHSAILTRRLRPWHLEQRSDLNGHGAG
jgi:hypothetical protein